MCFNAAASLAATAVLIPAGLHTLNLAWRGGRRFLPLAAFPLLFGVQQGLEGALWLGLGDPLTQILGTPPAASVRLVALGFLSFAFVLWPVLVPLAAYTVEPRPQRRRLFALLALLGAFGGLFIYLPLAIHPDWLRVGILEGSIRYEPKILFPALLSQPLGRGLYAMVVLVPLLASSETLLRRFGLLVLVSVVLSAIAYSYAFISVWCFFAALLSAWLAARLPEGLTVASAEGEVAPDAPGLLHRR
jgi:hypothetical protein